MIYIIIVVLLKLVFITLCILFEVVVISSPK